MVPLSVVATPNLLVPCTCARVWLEGKTLALRRSQSVATGVMRDDFLDEEAEEEEEDSGDDDSEDGEDEEDSEEDSEAGTWWLLLTALCPVRFVCWFLAKYGLLALGVIGSVHIC